jgi:hypothetical protein
MLSQPTAPVAHPLDAAAIAQAHQLYCQLTGQSLRLGFDRERMWYELLRAGFSLQDLHAVITYLQREIRAGRRYVGALKLCNLLQLDRFEEDLQISRVRLRPRHRRRLAPPHHPRQPRAPPSRNKLACGPCNAYAKSRRHCAKTSRSQSPKKSEPHSGKIPTD